MNNTNITEPMVPPMHGDPNFKKYYCPHCDKFLFRGNIQNLKMVCHHCQKLINNDASELIKKETDVI